MSHSGTWYRPGVFADKMSQLMGVVVVVAVAVPELVLKLVWNFTPLIAIFIKRLRKSISLVRDCWFALLSTHLIVQPTWRIFGQSLCSLHLREKSAHITLLHFLALTDGFPYSIFVIPLRIIAFIIDLKALKLKIHPCAKFELSKFLQPSSA